MLTPTGAGGFNILRPIETCIDRLSPTPTDIRRRFPRRFYGSSGFVSGVGGSGVSAGTKTVPVLTSAMRHEQNRSAIRGGSHVTFSMANDSRRAAFRASSAGLTRQPQRSLTTPAELRLLAVHDGRSMAYRLVNLLNQ